MTMTYAQGRRWMRPTAWLVAASLALPVLAGCGGPKNDNSNIPPPVDDTRSATTTSPSAPVGGQPQQHTGMTTKQKVAILAGAALLYYLYKHHQNQQNGQQVQYYLSKNGRVYYRDPQTHQVHWVTPVQVPESEAQEYSRYKGYNNQATGEDYSGPGDTMAAPTG